MDKTPLVDLFERTDFNNVKELDSPPLSGVIWLIFNRSRFAELREGEVMLIPQLRFFEACSGFRIVTCPIWTRRWLIRVRLIVVCARDWIDDGAGCLKTAHLAGSFLILGGLSEDNICISDAQYYELSAQQNLWCEILEFWAFEAISLIHSRLYDLQKKYVNKRVVKVALLGCHSAAFTTQYL